MCCIQEVYSQINPKEEPSDSAFGAVSPAPAINFALAAAVAFNKGNPGNVAWSFMLFILEVFFRVFAEWTDKKFWGIREAMY